MSPEDRDLRAAAWAPWAPVRRERPVRFWLIGLVGVAVTGIVVGLLVYQALRPRGAAAASDEGWADFGAALEGALAGVMVWLIAWFVLLLLFLRRYLDPGSRLAAGGTSIAVVVAAAGGFAVLGTALAGLVGPDVGGSGSWALLGAVQGAGLAGLAAPPVVVARARRRAAG